MKSSNRFLFFICLFICTNSMFAQNAGFSKLGNSFHCRVVDAQTLEPLENVIIKDSVNPRRTLIANKNGEFVITSSISSTYYISLLGYETFILKTDQQESFYKIFLKKGTIQLKDVVITNQKNILSTNKTISLLDLDAHPAKTAQDMLRLVPGLFVAQHQGGGKAEGLALRGFDADHGTDVSVSVDGVPVNLPAHAHGQGYADLHYLIPELVANYEWGKGPYYASKGDFTTAGFVHYNTKDFLNQNFVKLEGGLFKSGRVVGAVNLLDSGDRNKGKSLYMSGEAVYTDGGPFTQVPENFKRYNFFTKYITPIGDKHIFTLTASSLWSKWLSSGEIPERAVDEGYIQGRWGAFDNNQSGSTSRTNLIAKLKTDFNDEYTLTNQVYYSKYALDLYTNFTANYFFPKDGDEFRQFEHRDVYGLNSTLSKSSSIANMVFNTDFGIGSRTDIINPLGLDHTKQGVFLENIQLGSAKETNMFGFVDENIKNGNWLFNFGLRYDYFNFYYQNLATDTIATNIFGGLIPSAKQGILSPKFNIVYTFNPAFQLYLKTGKGFHSNDLRVIIAQQGNKILPAAYGVDLGFNWKPAPKFFINAAAWYLFLQSEFTYGSDLIDQPGGPISTSGRTVRYGIDFSARYQIADWLFAGVNMNLAHPRSIDDPKGQDYIRLAPTLTSTGEFIFRFKNGWNGGINYRYMHDRSGNEDYSLTAKGYFVTDLAINYTQKKYELGITIENLFNVKWDEIQREYISQFKGELHPIDQMSYIPGVPFYPKLKYTRFF